jgi:hypothetical protein
VTRPDQHDPGAQVVDDVDQLVELWPALTAALERDQGVKAEEKVAGGGTMLSLPINADVLHVLAALRDQIPNVANRCAGLAGERPNPRRTILDHLMHFPRLHDRLRATHAAAQAGQLAATIRRWLNDARRVIGLSVVDRRLGQFCPRHDDPLVELVVPGDQGYLVDRLVDAGADRGWFATTAVEWTHSDAVLCRHCEVSWSPGMFLLLGRMLRQADRRRVEAAAQAAELAQDEAA